MRFDQRQQVLPRHHLIHLGQKHLAPRLLALAVVLRVAEGQLHRNRPLGSLIDCRRSDCFVQTFPKRSTMQAIGNKRERAREARWEHFKASVRAKVEHPFRVIKRQFGYTKVRYHGLAKNAAQVLTLFALSNLWMVRWQLLPARGGILPGGSQSRQNVAAIASYAAFCAPLTCVKLEFGRSDLLFRPS